MTKSQFPNKSQLSNIRITKHFFNIFVFTAGMFSILQSEELQTPILETSYLGNGVGLAPDIVYDTKRNPAYLEKVKTKLLRFGLVTAYENYIGYNYEWRLIPFI